MFLMDYLMENLIRVSQKPPRVLKDNNLILLKGLMFILPMVLMCIHLWDILLTFLKGNIFILLMGKKITQIIMLKTHRVMQMFLSHPQILLILASKTHM
jgi:hypothetical protein